MITLLRRNQRWLLLIVAIITIIAFGWLYNTTDTEKLGANRVAEIYGRTLYRPDVDRAARLYQLALILGLREFAAEMAATAPSPERAIDEFVWNLFVLRHQAKSLWLEPSDSQVVEAIRALPALQKDGAFSPAAYAQFLQEQLAPRGLTERHLEELIRDKLRFESLRALVTSPVGLLPGQVEAALRLFQHVDAAVFRLAQPAPDAVPAPTEEDIKLFYERFRGQIQTPEFRSIAYIKASLPENEAALEGRARVEALQKLAEKISAIHDSLAGGQTPFSEAAQAAGLPITESPAFDAQGRLPNTENPARPGEPAGLPERVVKEAFRLSDSAPISEIIQDGSDFYLFKIREKTAPRALSLEEATPEIASLLRNQRAQESARQRALELRSQLAEQLAAGTPPEQAAQALGLELHTLQNLNPSDFSPENESHSLAARVAAELNEGQLSPPEQDGQGWFAVLLQKRHPLPDSELALREAFVRANLLGMRKSIYFLEWLRQARMASGLRMAQQG